MLEIYKNPDCSVKERVDDLLSRMNLDEKLAQLSCTMGVLGQFQNMEESLKNGIGQISVLQGSFTKEMNADVVQMIQDYLINNTRLGIPAMFHTETLNGFESAEATVYPIPMGLGATFDPAQVNVMADNIRKEVDAMGMKLVFGPVMDVARDPRWGRVGETYGENPTLASAMSVAYVKGIQGDDPAKGAVAVAKHFLGYAMGEGGINISAAHIGDRELREVYGKPFEAAIREADLMGVMNAYHVIDGEPIVSNPRILRGLLRDEMGFQGLTVSDYDSIGKLESVYCVAADAGEAGKLALEAGMDCELPFQICYGQGLKEKILNNEVSMDVVDQAVIRVLETKFKLGLFEKPYSDREKIKELFQNDKSLDDAQKSARESMVLLKNENSILPIDLEKVGSIAVIGPSADDCRNLFGGYTYPAMYEMLCNMMKKQAGGAEGITVDEGMNEYLNMLPTVEQAMTCYKGLKSIAQALKEAMPDGSIKIAKGCEVLGDDKSGFDEAITAAMEANLVIMVLGGKNGSGAGCSMGENVDSSDVGLPGIQEELLKAVFAVNKNIILVHMDGRPLSSVWAAKNIPAIIEAWHPGQCGAEAIVDVLTGKYNPGGKLPMTAVRNSGQIPLYADQLKGSGATKRGETNSDICGGYVDLTGRPLYPFGYGLSYTKFALKDLQVEKKSYEADESVRLSVKITNEGTVPGDEVIQLYFTDIISSITRPEKELAGFKRVTLDSNETKTVEFEMKLSQLAFLDQDMNWKVEHGEIRLLVGTSSIDLPLTETITINNSKIIDSCKRSFFATSKIV